MIYILKINKQAININLNIYFDYGERFENLDFWEKVTFSAPLQASQLS